MKEVKLNPIQRELVKVWMEELNSILTPVQKLINETFNSRLSRLANELGIDLINENWSFDANASKFVNNELEEPKPLVPGRKVGRPKKEPPVIDVEAEPVTDEETQEKLPI